jgi:hypothetical protein
MLATTHRCDLHLTNGIPQVLASYEQATEALHLMSLVVDRETMAADALFTTEYGGSHSGPHHQHEPVSLTRLLHQRWFVRTPHRGSAWHGASRGRSCSVSVGSSWQEGWQPAPAPASPTEPKLIPIVTTAPCADALELARAYIHRWPAQENVIRDWLIPLGLDYNHGYANVKL